MYFLQSNNLLLDGIDIFSSNFLWWFWNIRKIGGTLFFEPKSCLTRLQETEDLPQLLTRLKRLFCPSMPRQDWTELQKNGQDSTGQNRTRHYTNKQKLSSRVWFIMRQTKNEPRYFAGPSGSLGGLWEGHGRSEDFFFGMENYHNKACALKTF